MRTVKKRNGKDAKYESWRIHRAISLANDATEEENIESIDAIVKMAEKAFGDKDDISVEEIQDRVEDTLIKAGYIAIAKNYIRYRQSHRDRRSIREHLDKVYNQIVYGSAAESDLRRDNANINTDAPMGQMLKAGAEGMKHFIDSFVLPRDVYEADKAGWIHVHDKDFSLFTFNCCQIDLGKLFKGGFATGHGFLREPNSIRAAASLACIAIQSNQNDMFKLNQSY